MTTAADYINEYLARRAPIDMVAPYRHRNLLIRALWFKQARWEAEAIVRDCAKPSAEYDAAFDAMIDAGDKHRAAIIDAAKNRALTRFAQQVAA
jgi:hypothetical protein